MAAVLSYICHLKNTAAVLSFPCCLMTRVCTVLSLPCIGKAAVLSHSCHFFDTAAVLSYSCHCFSTAAVLTYSCHFFAWLLYSLVLAGCQQRCYAGPCKLAAGLGFALNPKPRHNSLICLRLAAILLCILVTTPGTCTGAHHQSHEQSKHLHSVETCFNCPQTFLLDLQCRDDVSELK